MISIIIPTRNQVELFKRTIHSVATRPPSGNFEVIVVDANSTEDILGTLQLYGARFPYKFIRVDEWKNLELVGADHAQSDKFFIQQSDVMAWGKVYDELLSGACGTSTTFQIPLHILQLLDQYGSNFFERYLPECSLGADLGLYLISREGLYAGWDMRERDIRPEAISLRQYSSESVGKLALPSNMGERPTILDVITNH